MNRRLLTATDAEPEGSVVIDLPAALDLRRTIAPLLRGSGDPTMRFDLGGAWLALRTPDGGATLRLVQRPEGLRASAWGQGAGRALCGVPDLVGLRVDPSRLVPHDPRVAELVHRFPGLRLGRTLRAWDALLPAILEQKVTGREAWRAYRALVRTVSEPAPGPAGLYLPPKAEAIAELPYFALHPLGVERRRADVVRRAASLLAAHPAWSPDEQRRRLGAIPGIGPWTIAEVSRNAWGDPDAVSVGDYHLPSLVAWFFTGERRADDARMLELLEPYRGQRGRVQRLIEVAGRFPPRRGPRMAPRTIAGI